MVQGVGVGGGTPRVVTSLPVSFKSLAMCYTLILFWARCWCLTPRILATQEAEIRKITVGSQPWQIVFFRDPILKKTHHNNRAGRVAQGVGPEWKPQYYKKKKKILFYSGWNLHLPTQNGIMEWDKQDLHSTRTDGYGAPWLQDSEIYPLAGRILGAECRPD
jgi:hypothetical protein